MTRTYYSEHKTGRDRETRLPFDKWVRGLNGWEARFRGQQSDVYVPVDCLSPGSLAKIGEPPKEDK